MIPFINIGSYTIASYGLFIVLGLTIALLTSIFFNRKRTLNQEDLIFSFIYGCIGAVVGGKLFYLIQNIQLFFRETPIPWSRVLIYQLLEGGFVFYGGLIGAIAMVYRYSRKFTISFSHLLYAHIPVIPLAHAVGRIGCFFSGCCYGISYSGPLAVVFHSSPVAPNGISLLPIQLIEAALNLMVFFFLIYLLRKRVGLNELIASYFLLYGLGRFVLEFYRGDIARGHYLFLSTSQWISIFLIFIALFFIIKKPMSDT